MRFITVSLEFAWSICNFGFAVFWLLWLPLRLPLELEVRSAVLSGCSAGQHQPGLHQDTEEELVLDRLRGPDDAVVQHPWQSLKILHITSLDRTDEPGYLARRLIRSSRPTEIFQPPQQGFFSVHAQLQLLGNIFQLFTPHPSSPQLTSHLTTLTLWFYI